MFSLKKSFQTLLYALQNNSTLFPINNISFSYTYQKCCSAPTHFLVNTGFTASLYKTISFDLLIKAYGFIQTFGEACIYKKVSGSSVAFLILYVDDISYKNFWSIEIDQEVNWTFTKHIP